MLALLTGARRSNLRAMRWDDLDFDMRTWTIGGQESKNKQSMVIPLTDPAVAILQQRKAVTHSEYVFPSTGRKKSKTGHIMDTREHWTELLSRAQLSDLRLHDLRRTLGSYQTISGASTAIVGKTLGHKSTTATAVYTRLNLDPVRASMEKAIKMMLAMQQEPKDKEYI